MLNTKPVLLVEDDDVDALTVQRSLRDLGAKVQLVRSTNGEEALEYLRNMNNPIPCIILLDLNMPKMNGIEFLKITGDDERLKNIPVVVFTTTREDCDVIESLKLSITGCIFKSFDYQQFLDSMKALQSYWTMSMLPETV
ncbi:MAG: response regulator [Sedimentisphaerales bacterium]|nr:response regulator [Sedimentisphaerales bacterium]